ncbi:class E sortase [Aeromicrobium sp.]|uniref:class E sortase n=1 Tax=Aeromicrobium sp. TaxID=1871063 RepID=UPI002FC678B8
MTTTLARQAPERSIGRKIARALGVLLILAGLSMLAYIAWQYYGTNIVSKQKQNEVKEQIAKDWGKGIDSGAIGLLRVPRFGDTYEKPIVKGFDDGALARGVGWDPKSATPGQIGNFAIAGHRVTHGEVFSKFPKLKKGDLVYVETRTDVFTYKLRNSGTSITVDFTVGWPLQRVPAPNAAGQRPTKAVITLLTCSELFHTRNRNVVIGDLVDTVSKADSPAS